MTSCLLDGPISKHNTRLSDQLKAIQDKLTRLSGILTQFSKFSDEQLSTFEIADQLDSIQHCLTRFEARCLAI